MSKERLLTAIQVLRWISSWASSKFYSLTNSGLKSMVFWLHHTAAKHRLSQELSSDIYSLLKWTSTTCQDYFYSLLTLKKRTMRGWMLFFYPEVSLTGFRCLMMAMLLQVSSKPRSQFLIQSPLDDCWLYTLYKWDMISENGQIYLDLSEHTHTLTKHATCIWYDKWMELVLNCK